MKLSEKKLQTSKGRERGGRNIGEFHRTRQPDNGNRSKAVRLGDMRDNEGTSVGGHMKEMRGNANFENIR